MKKTMLITMSLSACIAFTTIQTVAQEAKENKPAKEGGASGHSHFTKIPEKLEDVWKAIHRQMEKLDKVVAKNDLGEAHDHAFAIRDLVKALPGKVPAESKAKAEAASKEITKIAADIDKSGAAGAQKATEANVKKMETAINTLENNLNAK